MSSKIERSFSQLLDKPVSSLHYLAMTLKESTNLEACIQGQVESQSFSLWGIAAIFASLKDSGTVPEDESFRNLVNSLTFSLQSQAKASFSSSCFLQQKRRETLVSHLPAATYASVKHAFLSTPPSPSLFAESVIKESLTQVKEDSNLARLKNRSSTKGSKQSASAASSSGTRHAFSMSGSSASSWFSKNSSVGPKSFKRPSSSSPARPTKVSFKGSSRSPTKKNFRKYELCPLPAPIGGCLSLCWTVWRDEGLEPWVVEVLRWGYRVPLSPPPLSPVPIPIPSYSPLSPKGIALREEVIALLAKGAIEEAPPPPTSFFYSRLFVVWKTSGS